MVLRRLGRLFGPMGLLGLLGLCAAGPGLAQTKADSGWVPLFNGKDFADFYAHFYTIGVVDMAKQDAFFVDSGMIHVRKARSGGYSGNQGHLFTRKSYSWYKVRVEYRFAADDASGSQNAGLIVHVDNDQALVGNTKERRPRSIEINMRRAEQHPWTLYSATGLGPYITTTVKPGTNLYQSRAEGGVEWTNDPWGQRIVASSYPNPERPMGQWNRGEAHIYGDSLGLFFLNGQLRTSGWDFRLRGSPDDPDPRRRIRCESGGIGLQSEVHEIWYRNFEIMELEPHTKRPLHAKPVPVRREAARGAGSRGARRGGLGAVEGPVHDLNGRTLKVTPVRKP